MITNNSPFFSIVIPVYQAQKYLPGMLDSIRSQTFTDYEVILVHDKGTDNSFAICCQYEQQDNRFHVYDLPQNKGAAGARNEGIKRAKGEYLCCMDADDTIDSRLLQWVYESLQKNPADYVVYGAIEEHQGEDGVIRRSIVKCPKEHYFTTKKQLHPYIMELEKLTLYGYPWNKFLKRSILEEHPITFPDWPLLEDLAFNIHFCNHISSMNVLAKTPYHYRIITAGAGGSLTSKFIKEYFTIHSTCVRMLLEQQKDWGICNDKVRRELAAIYVRYLFSALQRNCDKRCGMNFISRYRFLKKVYQSDLYKELIPYGKTEKLPMKVLLFAVKHKLTLCSLLLGRVIYIVKNKLPGIFLKLKQNRT